MPKNRTIKYNSHPELLLFGGLLTFVFLSATILASSHATADNDSVTDNISIEVPVSCTMTGTGQSSHEATLLPGTYSGASGSQYQNGIGTTTLTTFCNDNNGFSIYAIGYSADTDGNNTLIGENTSLTIPTKVYEATDTTSNWSMKVNKVENETGQDPVAWNPENMTITNSFNSWHTVPDDYAKVAEYKATTGSSATDTTLGGKVTTTYAAYISTTQAADTYEGQVKYVMVHPYDHTAPEKPATFTWQESTATRPADADVRFMMQDFDTATCNLGTTGQIGWVKDSRDNTVYTIGKLADGKCWMLDNLALDLVNSTVLNGMNENNTNASNTTLGYLKNGGGTTSDQWPTSGVSYWTSSSDSYSDPWIAIKNADDESWNPDTTTTSYGNGSGKIGIYYNYCAVSAGTYCWGNGTSYSGSPSSDPKTSSLYDIDGDICPKGWRMPTGDSSGEYGTLYGYYNTTQTATDPASLQYNLSTPLSGVFFDGSAYNQGSEGDFWSSTYSGDSSSMYVLYVNSTDVYPNTYTGRAGGNSVRCIIGS